MPMIKYGAASLIETNVRPDDWTNRVYSDACSDGKCRMKTARSVIAKYDPSKFLLSHCTIIAAVDVDEADKSASQYKDYLIKPEYSKWVNNNGDAWTKTLLKEAYKTFIGCNNYVEHVQIPELSKGKVIDAALREISVGKDKKGNDLSTYYVDILVATDRKHEDLVRKIQAQELNTLSMGCFLKGTEITLSDGTKISIEEVRPGDNVITHNGTASPVMNIQKKWYEGNILALQVEGDYKTTYVTPEHPFWAFNREQECACGCGEKIRTKLTGHKGNFDGKDFVFSKYKQGHYARVVNPNKKVYSFEEYKKLKDNNNIKGKLDLNWIKAGNLKVGDLVSYPVSQRVYNDPDATIDKARLIGYFLAEGSFVKEVIVEGEENDYGVKCRICGKIYNKISTHLRVHKMTLNEYRNLYPDAPVNAKINKQLIKISRKEKFDNIKFERKRKKIGSEFSLGSHEYDTVNKEICELSEKVFPSATILRYKKAVKIIGSEVADFFSKYCGEYFDGKRLPEEVLFWDPEIQKHLIATWILGDFNNTGSKVLFNQFHFILSRCRIIHNMFKKEAELYKTDVRKMTADGTEVINHYEGVRSESYQIQINTSGFDLLKDNLNFSFSYSNKWLKKSEKSLTKVHNTWKNCNTSNWIMRPIKKIEEVPYKGWVYNFEVEGDNSYIANDISVHNCVIAFSICTKCGNKAVDETEACEHVKYEKNNMFYDDHGVQRKIAELCGHESIPDSVRFVDASWVRNPAFTGAVLRDVVDPPADIMAKLEKAHAVESYQVKETDFLKAASHLIAQDEGDETPEEAPAGEDKAAPPEEEPAAEAPAEEPAEVPEEGMPEEEPVEFGPDDVKKWKVKIKNQILEELGDEIADEFNKKFEDRPEQLETLDESIIKPASVLKKVWGTKKVWDRFIKLTAGNLNKRDFNKLRYGAHMLLTSNDPRILADFGYNKRDFLAVLSFVDNCLDKPLDLSVKRAVAKLGGTQGKTPLEILEHVVSSMGRKVTKKEAQRSLAWLKILDDYKS